MTYSIDYSAAICDFKYFIIIIIFTEHLVYTTHWAKSFYMHFLI